MRMNLPIVQQEVVLDERTTIISTTDSKGLITSVNEDFIRISGFTEAELLGAPHNLVRHPDMPAEAFADLWRTLQSGQPWIGIVKNRCKNGHYYWVDAYVSPLYENAQVVGYQSVRTKADPALIARAERLYAALRAKRSLSRFDQVGLGARIMLAASLAMLPLLGAAILANGSWPMLAAGLVTSLLMVAGLSAWVARPFRQAGVEARRVHDNAVAQKVYSGLPGEAGQCELALHMLKARLRTALDRIRGASVQLADVAQQTAVSMEQVNESVRQQHSETDQVAVALNEMSATSQEVARNTAAAAGAARQADNETDAGRRVVAGTVEAIDQLAHEVKSAADVIHRLEDESNQIGTVLDVIKGIAEQTNLLALNAAIEAARAGEQGRGFAVVADEVRSLASRTQQSTREIHQMIERLQSGAREAVQVMERGRERADHGVQEAARAGTALEAIAREVDTISQMNTQIASAAEEQSAVTETLNRNVTNISQLSQNTSGITSSTARHGDQLMRLARNLESLIRQCRA